MSSIVFKIRGEDAWKSLSSLSHYREHLVNIKKSLEDIKHYELNVPFDKTLETSLDARITQLDEMTDKLTKKYVAICEGGGTVTKEDVTLKEDKLVKKKSIPLPLLKKMLATKKISLRDVLEEQMTPEILLAAVTADGEELRYIPRPLITKELCIAALLNFGHAFKYVPENLIDEDVCGALVSYHGCMLNIVPLKLRTTTVCDIAVKDSQMALFSVPQELRSNYPAFCDVKY